MERKYSVITGFLGKLKDRFTVYQPERDIEEMIEMAAKIKGCSGLELVYPYDFVDYDKLKRLLKDYSLGVSSVNLNIKSEEKWRFGAFTSTDPAIRNEAKEHLKKSMDIAADLGCNLVTTCPLADGSDYTFELDYVKAFTNTVDIISEAADYRDDVKISLEYKASEPRAHSVFNNAGKMAYLCSVVGKDNVGVTLDVGHAFQSLEIPADSAAFLGATNRLFYVHVNDNYRNWDWDMVPGTVNFWDYIEFILFLKKVGYNDWITADVFPQRHDPIRIMEKTFEWMDYLYDIVENIDEKKLFEMQSNNVDTFEIFDYVRSFIH